MRVVHVIQRFWPYVGGSERYFYELSTRLARAGHEVTVVTTDAWDLEHFWARGKRRVETPREQHEGVEIVRLPVRQLPGPPHVYLALRRLLFEGSRLGVPVSALRSLARMTPWVPGLAVALDQLPGPVDLVHATNVPFDSLMLAAEAFARRRRAPFMVTPFIHLGEPENSDVRKHYTMRHQLDLLRRADAVLVQTRMEHEYLIGAGVRPDRLHRTGVGVNPDEIVGGDAAAFRERHRISSPIVTFLGTAAYDKGTLHLIDAVLQLRRQGQDVTLVIAGPRLAHVDERLRRLTADERAAITVAGFISEAEKRDLLAATDVLALPSRTDSFGIVFLEAWLYGKPVIGALAGGIPGVVDDGRDGVLVRFGDTDALAAAIARLLADPALAARLGEAGRQKVLDGMTWDHVYNRIETLYHGLALRRPSDTLVTA